MCVCLFVFVFFPPLICFFGLVFSTLLLRPSTFFPSFLLLSALFLSPLIHFLRAIQHFIDRLILWTHTSIGHKRKKRQQAHGGINKRRHSTSTASLDLFHVHSCYDSFCQMRITIQIRRYKNLESSDRDQLKMRRNHRLINTKTSGID